jgi:integrase
MKTPLTDTFVKNLTKPGRFTDQSVTGLNLQVKRNGGKYWIFRYVYAGVRFDLSLGAYPGITLREARIRATAARAQLNKGERPEATWRSKQQIIRSKVAQTPVLFKDYATDCIATKRAEWRNPKHAEQWTSTIETYANPVIGNKPVANIDLEDILKILTPIWHTKTVTAARLRGRIEWVLASATTRRLREGPNPAAWKGLLETILPNPDKIKNEKHHSAMPYVEVPEFICQIQERDGIAALALQFLILNASRTGEVVGGRRAEISENGIWTIPGDRMKAGKDHRVPLAQRSLDLLQVAHSLDPDSEFLFSCKGKPLSNMAMAMLLRRMGRKETVHGFRSSFRDWVSEETQHSPEVAEKALAHTIPNKVEAAYRRGDLLEPRRRLIEDWAQYCLNGYYRNVMIFNAKRRA